MVNGHRITNEKTVPSRGTKRNLSVGRALQILEYLAFGRKPVKLQKIATDLSLSASTVLRFLNAFSEQGFIAQDPDTNKYFLTQKLSSLGDMIKSGFLLRDRIHPFLIEITDRLSESSSLAIEEDMQVVYIDLVEGPDYTLQTLHRIGKVAPMNTTAVGKALLLNYYPHRIDEYIRARDLPSLTPNSIVQKDLLMEELKITAERGFAVDNEECEVGVRCVAIPLREYTGTIIGAVGVTGPVLRMSEERLRQIGSYLVGIGTRIGLLLGVK